MRTSSTQSCRIQHAPREDSGYEKWNATANREAKRTYQKGDVCSRQFTSWDYSWTAERAHDWEQVENLQRGRDNYFL